MNKAENKRLVLFDFDGTLTKRDSLFAFLKFFKGYNYYLKNIIASLPVLIGYKLGLLDASDAKEKLLTFFFKNITTGEFESRCKQFSEEQLPLILNRPIVEKFQEHIAQGDRVIIVSASIEKWIKPWANQWDVEVLGTKLATKDGLITGKFEGKNCNGQEKVDRIKSYLNVSEFLEIWAYGDSKGDKPMLDMADIAYYKGERLVA
ncbi:MAG: HAD-IB family hydrolase [Cyclobacteriaceae bacterium]|nr:HAD-IB family hydrolase [Cyclobacteriaceae bacterium]